MMEKKSVPAWIPFPRKSVLAWILIFQEIGSNEFGSSVNADIPEFGFSVDVNISEFSSGVNADIPGT
ncbi:hypothetical protein RIR_jg10347.t1 [Rhizophagus irregularis DAOM 181602=DAOM 197198]|nr:hypothetical protein RIR_jg10347.t1 [Rhizophagus irregularis DAOM 181602=DAOM 197198]